MIEYLPQALSSLSAALEVGKSITGIRDEVKLQEAVMQFNSAIIDAQSKIISSQNEQTALSAKVAELENKCTRLTDWEAKRNKYKRAEIASGVFAYIEKDYSGKFENAHKYCCNCFDNNKESSLQQFDVSPGRKTGLSCHNKCPDLIFNYYADIT